MQTFLIMITIVIRKIRKHVESTITTTASGIFNAFLASASSVKYKKGLVSVQF